MDMDMAVEARILVLEAGKLFGVQLTEEKALADHATEETKTATKDLIFKKSC
jgi:hypothetical protein